MAKANEPFVILNFGYWGRFLVPVATATKVMEMMVTAGAMQVEQESFKSTSCYYPKKPSMKIEMLDQHLLLDCPLEEKPRKEYFAYLKTKAELVGEGDVFIPDSYEQFCLARSES